MPLGFTLKAWRLQDGSSPLDGAKEVGEDSRGSLPGCWAGWLPALAAAPARLPGKLLITRSLLSPLLAGPGPLGCPPPLAARPAGSPAPLCHSCCRRPPALQVLHRLQTPEWPRRPRRRDLCRYPAHSLCRSRRLSHGGLRTGFTACTAHTATSSRLQESGRVFPEPLGTTAPCRGRGSWRSTGDLVVKATFDRAPSER